MDESLFNFTPGFSDYLIIYLCEWQYKEMWVTLPVTGKNDFTDFSIETSVIKAHW